jgi:uncharacterized repeat protein (TIGR01451 family)
MGNATPPNSGNTVRGTQLAFSRDDHPEERTCGQNIAMLFDLSSSITPAILPGYLRAGTDFVNALQSTPSHVAVYTFGTSAPATGTNNATLPLQPTNTTEGLTALRDKIGGLSVVGSQFTNWDAGLWQIANSGVHYDLVVMITDGDPTAFGRPPGLITSSLPITFQKIENGVFSANALKNTGASLQVVGIDVPSTASRANLRSISGTGDFISTDFTHLADEMKAVALETCYGLQIEKSATPTTYTHVGQQITFHYTVTNTGSEELPLHNVMVTDNRIEHPITCAPPTILPGQHALCTATYAITQHDLDAGHVTNTAHATGETETGDTVTSDSVDETVHASKIEITKRAFPTEFGVAGERITYTFTVTNTGETRLDPVNVHDSRLGPIACPRDELDPRESMTCEFIHTTTEEDVEAGHIHNVVTVTGRDPEGMIVDDNADATVTHIPGPGIQIEKVAFPTQYAVPGEVITYTYRVVNTGAVTLRDVALTDSRLGGVTCPSSVLEPGHEMDCTGRHTITAADVAAGHIHNVATVTGRDEQGRHVSDDDDATVTAIHGPGIQIEKTASPITFSAAGQTIHYTYRVANTGTVTLRNISLSDSKVGTITNCASTTLPPGGETTCTATYTTTQADVARGYIPNFAFARGYKPDGTSITSPEDEAIVTGPIEVPVTG